MDYFQKRTFFFLFIFLSYGLDLHLGEYSKRWSIILSIQNIYVMETSLYSSAGDEIQGMHSKNTLIEMGPKICQN